jgi:uncharacterized protein YlxW (UPF0749 family)
MSLLVDLSASSLDPGYAEAAARRAATAGDGPAGDGATGRRRGGGGLAVGVLVATLLIVVAAVQAHVRAPAAARTRSDLVGTVARQNAAVEALARQVEALRAQVAQLRDAALAGSATGAALTARIRAQELASGAIAVSGPGLRVTLDDSTAPTTGTANRIQDRDLQDVVNALWAAGAEAITINGQRLTDQSAIRQAGDAILVDFAPLAPPYQVLAVGDPVAVATAFGSSTVAARLRFDYSRQTQLHLPAAAGETLHYARPIAAPNARGGTP